MELMNPCGTFDAPSAPLAPRIELGANATVGLFANDKMNADVLLGHLQTGLAENFGVRDFRWFRKEATQPAVFTPEVHGRLRCRGRRHLRLRLLHVVVYP